MAEWTQEQLLQQAQNNAMAVFLGSIAYIKQNGGSVTDWATAMGTQFAPGWEGLRGGSALDVARSAAFNPISLGGSLVSLEGSEQRATAVLDFPITEIASSFGVSLDEADHALTTLYKTIFAALHINFTSHRNGERWTYELSY